MITMELLGKIRPMHARDKMLVRKIAKRTGLSHNTLQKWFKTPDNLFTISESTGPGKPDGRTASWC